jgi:excisionase family DNA binding protein
VQSVQAPQQPESTELLTARQVQTMLHIDRSTVYRMAEDGRLPAIKVGRQWRFPADHLTALLEAPSGLGAPAPLGAPVSPTTPVSAPVPAPAASLVPTGSNAPGISAEVASAVAQVAADLLAVMMVVTDMDGHPITGVANPCPWFAERAGDPGLLKACTAEWQQLADDADFAPRFATGALGFECARAFVRCGTSLVGMVLAGGLAPAGSSEPGLYHLDAAQRRAVLAALPRVARALSRVPPRSAS